MQFKLWESTMSDLYTSAVRAFPFTTKRQHSVDPLKVIELHWIPYLGLKTLYVRGKIKSESKDYSCSIVFKKVVYGSGLPLVASDGKTYFMERLSSSNNDVLLRCDCPDFRWRFRYYNYVDESLYGNKGKKYESLGVGPPANPSESPGMCKHLMSMMRTLNHSGILLS